MGTPEPVILAIRLAYHHLESSVEASPGQVRLTHVIPTSSVWTMTLISIAEHPAGIPAIAFQIYMNLRGER